MSLYEKFDVLMSDRILEGMVIEQIMIELRI